MDGIEDHLEQKAHLCRYIFPQNMEWACIGDRIIDSALTMPCFLHTEKPAREPQPLHLDYLIRGREQAHKSESLNITKMCGFLICWKQKETSLYPCYCESKPRYSRLLLSCRNIACLHPKALTILVDGLQEIELWSYRLNLATDGTKRAQLLKHGKHGRLQR
jgi:hypothetical protein